MQKQIPIILMTILIIFLGLLAREIGYEKELKKENKKIEEQKIEEEIGRLNQYFREYHNYYLQKISAAVSIGPRQVSVEELTRPSYFLVEEDSLIYTHGMDCFSFSSREEAIKIWNQLNKEEKDKYCVISQSIIRISSNNEKDYHILQEARTYFEDNEK